MFDAIQDYFTTAFILLFVGFAVYTTYFEEPVVAEPTSYSKVSHEFSDDNDSYAAIYGDDSYAGRDYSQDDDNHVSSDKSDSNYEYQCDYVGRASIETNCGMRDTSFEESAKRLLIPFY